MKRTVAIGIQDFETLRTGSWFYIDTASNALKQIEEKQYEAELTSRGIPSGSILKYGLAFRGKECRILKG